MGVSFCLNKTTIEVNSQPVGLELEDEFVGEGSSGAHLPHPTISASLIDFLHLSSSNNAGHGDDWQVADGCMAPEKSEQLSTCAVTSHGTGRSLPSPNPSFTH